MPNSSSHRQNPQLVALGHAIRRLRKTHGLSQEQLGLQAEVDTSYLGRIERGDNNAAILTISKIAEALHLTVAELMVEAGI